LARPMSPSLIFLILTSLLVAGRVFACMRYIAVREVVGLGASSDDRKKRGLL
jgi:hypothetical protein